ncbi:MULTISPECIES: hypothetical protein [unclassified Acinetobacter]|uniref:hypothetical protein n=1 Tax=unclassified Acinetobacter TaxID=196816 RepID=UPI0015D0F6B3|nr:MULTISPECIES: hypothetical protein [unclassified Acinetobacter]UUS59683.1 hypothetical protein MST17_09790 [Acinetobacter sp. YH16056_T]
MKNMILAACLLGLATNIAAASAEQYVIAVNDINEKYKTDVRQFFSQLDPQQQGFKADQQVKYCGIVQTYVNDLYRAADENRAFLDREYRNMNKQDVIQQVIASKEMQLLKKYNVQCTLN